MIKHNEIRVLGKVQGVWFRKYAQEAALARNLVGMVKNEPDGSVYVEAEGEENDLTSFVQWLYTGSPLSKVTEVKWEEGDIIGYADFKISP